MGSDKQETTKNKEDNKIFQSTLPAWGATGAQRRQRTCRYRYFNPRSPHGERPIRRGVVGYLDGMISIHAPRMGSDTT